MLRPVARASLEILRTKNPARNPGKNCRRRNLRLLEYAIRRIKRVEIFNRRSEIYSPNRVAQRSP
jgi:hypothetical protein